MTGPCLCGDPYCPSCGNPAAAELEAAADAEYQETTSFAADLPEDHPDDPN